MAIFAIKNSFVGIRGASRLGLATAHLSTATTNDSFKTSTAVYIKRPLLLSFGIGGLSKTMGTIRWSSDQSHDQKSPEEAGYDDGYSHHHYPRSTIRFTFAITVLFAALYVLLSYEDPPRKCLYSLIILYFALTG